MPLPILTRDETCALAKLAQAGDSAARNELIVRNMALVTSVAQKYRGRGLDMDDLIGEGNLGLFPAIANFDSALGAFTTYATWWIKQAIRSALAYQGHTIRIPHNIGLKVGRADKARQYGKSLEDVATDQGWPENERLLVLQAMRVSARQPNLDCLDWAEAPTDPAGAGTGLDLGYLLRHLDPQSIAVVKKRLRLDALGLMNPGELAMVAAVPPKYAKKIYYMAMQRLRRKMPLRSMARRPA